MSKGFIILCTLAFCMIVISMCGCGGNEVKPPNIKGDDNDVKIKSKQEVNNPWPWMIAVIILPIAFLAYLYASKKFIGFGRT